VSKKNLIIIGSATVILLGALYFFFFMKDLKGIVSIPYVVHNYKKIDPHIPSANPLDDKLDEVVYDGLFNMTATPSGVVYEDGLGKLTKFENNVATVRLKLNKFWHSSFDKEDEGEDVILKEGNLQTFTAKDLKYSLDRIARLKSLSPDFILVSQALDGLNFTGPNNKGEISFRFQSDRIWTENEVKEVLSFKIVPFNSLSGNIEAVGTGPYLFASEFENTRFYKKNPKTKNYFENLFLKPFVDNSTYATELDNGEINVLLNSPFGSLNPILSDTTEFFSKSKISTTFFSILFNTRKININTRRMYRSLIDPKVIMDELYKVNTEQQRHIIDYKGNKDNYSSYLNSSVFPSSSYYIKEKVVEPTKIEKVTSIPVRDTLDIKVFFDYGSKEELSEIAEIMNNPEIYGLFLRVSPATNEDIISGNYDAILLPVNGYRSNFSFDLYSIFLRSPNLEDYQINLKTTGDEFDFNVLNERSNFFRLFAADIEVKKLYESIYGFMSTSSIGDRQYYSRKIDEYESNLALGIWLFSKPNLSYFSKQFDEKSIHLYGAASQLSTIEYWKEKAED
jgi:hypothetical protein